MLYKAKRILCSCDFDLDPKTLIYTTWREDSAYQKWPIWAELSKVKALQTNRQMRPKTLPRRTCGWSNLTSRDFTAQNISKVVDLNLDYHANGSTFCRVSLHVCMFVILSLSEALIKKFIFGMQVHIQGIMSSWYMKVIGSSQDHRKWNENCIDFECVRKPTESRLSLTDHENKSSGWTETLNGQSVLYSVSGAKGMSICRNFASYRQSEAGDSWQSLNYVHNMVYIMIQWDDGRLAADLGEPHRSMSL